MPEQTMREMRDHMNRTVDVLKSSLAKVQTGRANPAMVEDVIVEYYGAPTPLKQLATIAAPDPNLLVVQPYDKTQMESVEKAILAADLGLNPTNDGKVIRVKVPKLSEERRQELVRVIKAKGEESKVALRNIRRDEERRRHLRGRPPEAARQDGRCGARILEDRRSAGRRQGATAADDLGCNHACPDRSEDPDSRFAAQASLRLGDRCFDRRCGRAGIAWPVGRSSRIDHRRCVVRHP